LWVGEIGRERRFVDLKKRKKKKLSFSKGRIKGIKPTSGYVVKRDV
jgi:hypothetical protein